MKNRTDINILKNKNIIVTFAGTNFTLQINQSKIDSFCIVL